MKHKNGKTVIEKSDLNKKVVLIRNYSDYSQLRTMQAAIMDANPNVIAIPRQGFQKYNKFRNKNKLKRLLLKDCHEVDVAEQMQVAYNEKLEDNKEFVETNTPGNEADD